MALRIVRVDIASQLSDGEWRCIDAFKYQSQRLAQTGLVEESNAGRVKWTLSITPDGMTSEGVLPSEALVVEHLAALRFFLLEKEPSFFNKVVNILSKHSRSEDAVKAYRQLRAQWKNALFQDAVSVEWNGGKITAGGLLDLWLNGEYFHGDEAAKIELERLWHSVPKPVTKWLLIESALGSTSVVLKLNEWLKGLTRRAES